MVHNRRITQNPICTHTPQPNLNENSRILWRPGAIIPSWLSNYSPGRQILGPRTIIAPVSIYSGLPFLRSSVTSWSWLRLELINPPLHDHENERLQQFANKFRFHIYRLEPVNAAKPCTSEPWKYFSGKGPQQRKLIHRDTLSGVYTDTSIQSLFAYVLPCHRRWANIWRWKHGGVEATWPITIY